MPTTLEPRDHLDGLREAMLAFVRYADRAGLRAAVPTAPEWTVRQLVAHQGMVHRWAASGIRGPLGDATAMEEEGLRHPDPLEWLRDGAVEVAGAIHRAPDDLDAPVFLRDAPPPKRFWARRQCHETTIHAVDALAAALGRPPHAVETWIREPLALDGIDELLRGFLPRSRSRLRTEEPTTVGVRPDAGGRAWLLEVGPQPPVTTEVAPGDGRLDEADVLLEGGPVALYLTLWNRSDETGPVEGLSLWRERARVVWG
jgi:uncharacterized protein (TIGR03083 family)